MKAICPHCGQEYEKREDPPPLPVADAHKADGFVLVGEGEKIKVEMGDRVEKGLDGVKRIYRKGAV